MKKKQNDMLNAALEYRRRGLSVIPCGRNKKPLIDSWMPYQTKHATEEEIKEWFTRWPDANIAIVTGKLSNRTVIDADNEAAIDELESCLSDSLEIPIGDTPRGGRHYHFQFCKDLPSNSAGLGGSGKIDIRSEGGYVIAPPSKTKDGEYKWNKRFNLKTTPLPQVPKAWLDLLKAGASKVPLRDPSKPLLKEGTRDNDLFHAALMLFKDRRPRGEVERIIVGMAKACNPPFPEQEARRKVENAWKRFQQKKTQKEDQDHRGVFVGTLEEFVSAEIAAPDYLVEPYVFRGGFTMIGGVKGSHKTFFSIHLGLHLASGLSGFLNSKISSPGRVLFIQQEVTAGFMQKRLKKILAYNPFRTEGRFIPITTTGNQKKILDDDDFKWIENQVIKFTPDLLILDPISSFHAAQENAPDIMGKIRDRINLLKSRYNLGVLITQHFSSKRNPDDQMAPTEAAGWFRGHTILSDAADTLVCLHRLRGQQANLNLPKNFEDYNTVEITLRNGQWPEKFESEFDGETFNIKFSNVLYEIGKKILPQQIFSLLKAEGDMLRSKVIEHFPEMKRAARRAIDEAVKQGLVEKEELPGRGKPVMLRAKRTEK